MKVKCFGKSFSCFNVVFHSFRSVIGFGLSYGMFNAQLVNLKNGLTGTQNNLIDTQSNLLDTQTVLSNVNVTVNDYLELSGLLQKSAYDSGWICFSGLTTTLYHELNTANVLVYIMSNYTQQVAWWG